MITPDYAQEAKRTERVARWMYRGIWSVLVRMFRVPQEAPELPVGPDEQLQRFQPGPGYLRYLKLGFWIGVIVVDSGLFILLLAIAINEPVLGVLLLPPALIIGIVPFLISYVAIHLRFDTTWYVMTDRSLRLRRGVWSIHEITITFENVQNVKVRQGPLQRYFGIADVVVETAGGGGGAAGAHGKQAATTMSHHGIIEGIDNAAEVRDRILARLKHSKSAGLGDEHHAAGHSAKTEARTWSAAHLATLREIRDEVHGIVGRRDK